MRMLCLSILAATALLLSGCMNSAYYFKRGQKAYALQDYHTAFENTLVAANYGSVQAQYAVGYMYFYGLGTTQNPYLARLWMYRAASVGNLDAMHALKTIDQAAPNPILLDAKKPWRQDTYTQPTKLPQPHKAPLKNMHWSTLPTPKATKK